MSRYGSAPAFRQALEDRLKRRSQESHLVLARLRRRVVFERLLTRLVEAMPGEWVLKGGMALEVRLRERARRTKDIDLVTRATGDAEGLHERIVEAVRVDRYEDWFDFVVEAPSPLAPDEAGRPGWRFHVEAQLAGRLFDVVNMDVVARGEEVAATIMVPLPNSLDFAEIPTADVEVVDPKQHFAEKLHAYTKDYGVRPSGRVRDLPDMILLIEDGLRPSPDLLAVVEHVFAERALQPVPGELPEPPAEWADGYAQLASQMTIEPQTLAEATEALTDFWHRAVRSKEA